ncbi:MAG TPA: hypothetical protein PKC28_15110 [Bdellovibrionales bacterium]|nr:hypothetical protein [Bdellovibrionales bacterium]
MRIKGSISGDGCGQCFLKKFLFFDSEREAPIHCQAVKPEIQYLSQKTQYARTKPGVQALIKTFFEILAVVF